MDDLEAIWHQYRFFILFFSLVALAFLGARRRFWSKRAENLAVPGFKPIESRSEKAVELSQAKAKPQRQIVLEHAEIRAAPRQRIAAKRVSRSKATNNDTHDLEGGKKIQPLVFYFSLTESTRSYANNILRSDLGSLSKRISKILPPEIHDLADVDSEDFFERLPRRSNNDELHYFYLFLIPSYNIDTILDTFLGGLQEIHHDFRIDTAPLAGAAGYSVFGFGDREDWPTEADGFCYQAVEVDKWMAKLTSRKRAYPLGMGDVKSDVSTRFSEWSVGISRSLESVAALGHLGDGYAGSGDAVESDEEQEEVAPDQQLSEENRVKSKKRTRPSLDDLEDLGSKAPSDGPKSEALEKDRAPLAIDFTTTARKKTTVAAKEMVPVNSPTYTALTKQGYTIIGSHSGVKICRWTKSALRGRGSCYKYSFYGIKSHLCMETTPSLSCSNKCVFCWRHGTNPVGTTWRWQVDPPELIFDGAKEGHYKKIKMMRGVPGVRAERFQEAMRIRHCALSLVGEPIFYPHINKFVSLLHKERISSFLVCNAQHPDQLAALRQVTQLYVSIDASNAESLRKIDRPLHRDYWQRFLRCLDVLRERRAEMRTVFRLTLVKGFNIDEEVEGYADLVAQGLPCFVEIKGVTYCGTSSSAGAGLTMQNVPFYAEIVAFVEALDAALKRRGLEYGVAAEHAHSCCALIASKRFLRDGRWHTLINYDRFFECLDSGKPFGPEDYVGPPTPDWATWGQGGFDPADERVYRKGKKPASPD